jgi:hypothetical protein
MVEESMVVEEEDEICVAVLGHNRARHNEFSTSLAFFLNPMHLALPGPACFSSCPAFLG